MVQSNLDPPKLSNEDVEKELEFLKNTLKVFDILRTMSDKDIKKLILYIIKFANKSEDILDINI